MSMLTSQMTAMAGPQLPQRLISARPSRGPAPARALFGFGKKNDEEKSWREQDREEQFKLQQEVLARRKNNSWQEEVLERRARASRYLNDPVYKKQCDEENRKKFLAKKALEEPVPKFGIIIPLIPIGLPEYDGGERFDLRLPYVDNGWVDDEDESGVGLSDFGNSISRFFGMGKKKKKGDEPKSSGKKGGQKKK